MSKKKTVSKGSPPSSKRKVNKSQLIRDYYLKNSDAKPAEIVEWLSKKGITVSAQQVSTTRMNAIKSGMLPAGNSTVKVVGPRRRGRPVGSGRSRARKGGAVSIEALVGTKKLIEQVGIENVKDAITTLEQLLD